MTTGGKQSSPRTSVAVPRPTRPVRRSDSTPALYAPPRPVSEVELKQSVIVVLLSRMTCESLHTSTIRDCIERITQSTWGSR